MLQLPCLFFIPCSLNHLFPSLINISPFFTLFSFHNAKILLNGTRKHFCWLACLTCMFMFYIQKANNLLKKLNLIIRLLITFFHSFSVPFLRFNGSIGNNNYTLFASSFHFISIPIPPFCKFQPLKRDFVVVDEREMNSLIIKLSFHSAVPFILFLINYWFEVPRQEFTVANPPKAQQRMEKKL